MCFSDTRQIQALVPGVVYRPLSDVHHDISFKTVLLWLRGDLSPLLREFLAVAREVFDQRKKTSLNFEEGETFEQDVSKNVNE
jgi:hypothetical protein